MSNPRGYNGARTIREERRSSVALARRIAAEVPVRDFVKGMTYRAALNLYERFRAEASLIGDRVTGCAMKVGV